ncbi:MAG TPA: Spy/CpxP family protein refolding chaperone [Methylomirabilota bacterium]|nr:Spy/CpxP family protein refolding chaperone [Methylomirabilota bacterium]
MRQRMQWIWMAALLMAPIAASAQVPKPAPEGAPPAVAPAPGAPGEDDMMTVLDELFGEEQEPLGFEQLAFDGPGDEPGHGERVFDDEGGPGDSPKHVRRIGIGGPHGRGMMRRGMAMRFAALDLTDAQRDKLRDIHEASARKSVQRRADLQLAHMDLRKLMRAESPNAASVNSQIDKISRLQAEGMKAHFDTFMQARAVLTPEQQKQLRSEPGPMKMRMEHGGRDAD